MMLEDLAQYDPAITFLVACKVQNVTISYLSDDSYNGQNYTNVQERLFSGLKIERWIKCTYDPLAWFPQYRKLLPTLCSETKLSL